MTLFTRPGPTLEKGRMYLAWDRFVCGTLRCAGSTAFHTGVTIDGVPVEPITPDDVRAYYTPDDADIYAGVDLGPMQCQCGSVVLRNPQDAL